MKGKIDQYIKEWEEKGYASGIPEEVPKRLNQLNKAPSYKAICLAILNNNIKSLGFTPKKSKYYHYLKKIEIDARNNQLKLF